VDVIIGSEFPVKKKPKYHQISLGVRIGLPTDMRSIERLAR